RVDGQKWLQITIVCRIDVDEVILSDDRLAIRDVEKVDHRYHVPAVIQDEFTGDTQIKHVYAREPLDSCWLKDDRLASLGESPVCAIGRVSAENLNRLDGQPCVVLEVHASADLPRQFITAVHFKNKSCVGIQIVIVAVDVIVGIGEIVASRLIRKATAVNTFL